MTAPVFVDTNVFVYRHDSGDPSKQVSADRWIRLLARERAGRVSFQVLQELYITLTGKARLGFGAPEARGIVRELTVWRPVAVDRRILERAWYLQDNHSISWWDALIVAAAQSCDCGILLTEDLQHGHAFDDVRVVNPFAENSPPPREIIEVGSP